VATFEDEYPMVTRLERAARGVISSEEDLGRYLTGVDACLVHLRLIDAELFLTWQAEFLERLQSDPG
jgi:hypothetical protein